MSEKEVAIEECIEKVEPLPVTTTDEAAVSTAVEDCRKTVESLSVTAADEVAVEVDNCRKTADSLPVTVSDEATIEDCRKTVESLSVTATDEASVTDCIKAVESLSVNGKDEGTVDEKEEILPLDVSDNGLQKFLDNIASEKLKFSKEIACETVKLLERIINNSQWKTAKELMDLIKDVGKTIEKTVNKATHTVVFNMVKRVLKIIRDEYSTAMGKVDEYDQQESLQKMIIPQEQLDFMEQLDNLKKSISANLRELMEEYERSSGDIVSLSMEHIHPGETILTFGGSRTVEKFLRKASKLDCKIIIAEAEPSFSGQAMAMRLAENNIEVTLIQDAATTAIMPRVDKVIIGTHSVMGNGGLKSLIGTRNLAVAAKFYSKPLLVLASMFKLSPQFVTSSDQEGFNHYRSPEELIPLEYRDLLPHIEVINPAFDYVEPELISLIVSNVGANATTYVNKLLSEMYHLDDYNI